MRCGGSHDGAEPSRTSDMNVMPVTLDGRFVRLTPMSIEHHAALCSVGLDPELWRFTTISVATPDEMHSYMENALAAAASGSALPFVIELRDPGTVIGTTRYHSIAREHRRLEIGFTWIGRAWQRTTANTESKYLLLRHAFETLGAERVEFKADAENEPSRRALLRIGATEEGVLRHYMLSKLGGTRDLRIFSIVRPEWAEIRRRLEERLSDLR